MKVFISLNIRINLIHKACFLWYNLCIEMRKPEMFGFPRIITWNIPYGRLAKLTWKVKRTLQKLNTYDYHFTVISISIILNNSNCIDSYNNLPHSNQPWHRGLLISSGKGLLDPGCECQYQKAPEWNHRTGQTVSSLQWNKNFVLSNYHSEVSHWRPGVSNHQQIECLFNGLFRLKYKEIVKALNLWGESTGELLIPLPQIRPAMQKNHPHRMTSS